MELNIHDIRYTYIRTMNDITVIISLQNYNIFSSNVKTKLTCVRSMYSTLSKLITRIY